MEDKEKILGEVHRLWLDILRDESQKPELRMKAGDKLVGLIIGESEQPAGDEQEPLTLDESLALARDLLLRCGSEKP